MASIPLLRFPPGPGHRFAAGASPDVSGHLESWPSVLDPGGQKEPAVATIGHQDFDIGDIRPKGTPLDHLLGDADQRGGGGAAGDIDRVESGHGGILWGLVCLGSDSHLLRKQQDGKLEQDEAYGVNIRWSGCCNTEKLDCGQSTVNPISKDLI